MTLGTIINKCGFEARFNTSDFAFVDVRFFLFVPGAFANLTVVARLRGAECRSPVFQTETQRN